MNNLIDKKNDDIKAHNLHTGPMMEGEHEIFINENKYINLFKNKYFIELLNLINFLI